MAAVVALLVLGTSSCPFRGASIPCARAERDAAFARAQEHFFARHPDGLCTARGTRSRASISALEPLFTGEEWPTLRFKSQWMAKGMTRPLWTRLSAEERAQAARRVFIDVGARKFASSTAEFLGKYPDASSFDHVVGVEMDGTYARSWASDAAVWGNQTLRKQGRSPRFEMMHAAFASYDGAVQMPISGVAAASKAMLHLPVGSQLSSRGIGMHQRLSTTQMEEVPVHNMSRWLLARYTPADFVVLKLDVEGTEYELLPLLINTGAMAVIDELFIEMHYSRQSWHSANRRSKCSKTAESDTQPCVHRQEALRWLVFLRKACVYVHEWS